MFHRAIRLLGLAVFALLGGGCGTVGNLRPPGESVAGDPEKRVYGGIRSDLDHVQYNLDSSKPRMLFPLAVALGLFDLPFSFVGDTLTLPYTLAYDLGLFGRRYVDEVDAGLWGGATTRKEAGLPTAESPLGITLLGEKPVPPRPIVPGMTEGQ